MILREFSNSDLDACKTIWNECFSEDKDYCDYYFESVHSLGNAFVCEHQGSAVSYLNLIPFEAELSGAKLQSRYVYAVSTKPSMQRNGFMKNLLRFALSKYENDILFLIPRVEGVYEKFGFLKTQESISQLMNVHGDDFIECNDIQHLNSIYNRFREKFNFSIARNPNWWKVVLETAKQDNCKIIANNGAYAFLYDDRIAEIAYVDDIYKNKLLLNKPLCLNEVMFKSNLKIPNPYIALMLD